MQQLSSVASYSKSALGSIQTTFSSLYTHAQPILGLVVEKIKEVWATCRPVFHATANFLTTRIGASLSLMGFSIIPFIASRHTDNKAIQIALLAVGILVFAAGVYVVTGLPLPPSVVSLLDRPWI